MASSPTLGLRIAAVFILFVVSALGCLTPYLFIRVSKRKERRKQSEHGDPAQQQQQQQQLEGAEQGNNGSGRQQGDKKHQHHAHLEAFQTTRAMHLLKAFSAGIVISVGFVHVLAEAQEKLGELTDYPVAPVISMVGCITVLALTQVLEGIVTGRRMARRLAKQKAAKEARAAATAERAAAAATAGAASMTPTAAAAVLALGGNGGGLVELTTPRGGEEEAGGVDPMHEHQRQLMEKLSLARLTVHEEQEESVSAPTSADGRQPLQPQQQETGGVRYDEAALAAMEAGRAPLCSETSSLNTPRNYSRANSLTPRNNPNADLMDLSRSFGPVSTSSRGGGGKGGGGAWYLRSPSSKRAASMERRQSSFQLFHQHGHEGSIVYSFKKESIIVAYLMEIGIVFHSVLIGIGLGVIQSDVAEVKTLLLAICVHQFFEGAGLATCILEAQLERRKNFYMFGLFSVTTSTGVCLGIALASIYDPESTSAALLEGCFNSFASGLLICLALVDMMAEEFHRTQVKKDRVLQMQMFACIFAGAGIMSVLAIWA